MSMIRLDRVAAGYGSAQVLFGLDLQVGPGEVVSLMGRNGMGKSTTLRAIMGLVRVTGGTVSLFERDITNSPSHVIAQAGVGYVPEGRRIFPRMTVLENLQLGAELAPGDHFHDDAERVFELFPILEQRASQRGGTLSGGEQQMLAVARALMGRPRLLLLDEPSLGLAPLIVKQIFSVIGDLNRKEGLTVFLVEQNAYHALNLAHRGYVMVNGRITMTGTGKELLAKKEIRAAYLEGGRH